MYLQENDFYIQGSSSSIWEWNGGWLNTGEPHVKKVAKVTWDQVKTIAEDKMVDLNAFTIDSAMKMVAGTARSMGITVKGGEAPK